MKVLGAVLLFSAATLADAQTTGTPPRQLATTPLHRAVERDDIPEATRLIRAGADVKTVNRYGAAPISVACARGNAAMIELLLESGADANTSLPEGETCLMSAAGAGSLAAVKALLVRGAKINTIK